MTNLSALKTKQTGKGEPPEPTKTPGNLKKAPRDDTEPKTRLEFLVPQSIDDAFREEAAKRFGLKRGSQSKLFMAMWDEYTSRNSG